MSRATYTAEQFVKAIKNSGGIITTIAARVGCDWNTARKWITTHPTIQAAYQNECETVSDVAQSILMTSIKDGNTQDAKWWLARKRRAEFGDNLDVTSDGKTLPTSIIIYIPDNGREK
jgi:hypothetical protein